MKMRVLWIALAMLPAMCALRLHAGTIRTYYIAAEEVDWDYAPDGIDRMTGKPFEGYSKIVTERGPHRIGTKYRKAIYREYTDATFTTRKPRAGADEYLGILGPVIRAEVGDTIRVVFHNNASRPYTVHPHGVFYKKDAEGALYEDGTSGKDKADDGVPPDGTYTYVWEVPERAGPGPSEGSSVAWLYHSHHDEPKDVNSGLVGLMIITARGKARKDGSPLDVDRELVVLFKAFDENQSWYFDQNIKTYAGDPAGANKGESVPLDDAGNFTLTGRGFADTNIKWSINGRMYGNMPMITMKQGERVRWYLATVGEGLDFHTPHWHGNVVMSDRKRVDVVALSSAQTIVADMTPDNPGMWMFHCHVDDHMRAGMHTHYQVLPAAARSEAMTHGAHHQTQRDRVSGQLARKLEN